MQIQHETIRKILYINLAFMGDLLLATPALRALRLRYPEAQIDMLVTPWAAKVAVANPYVDQVRLYDKKGRDRRVSAVWQMITKLRQEKYDMAISANFSIRGAVLARLIGARYRIGYAIRGGSLFLTHPVSAKRETVKHETENQVLILGPLGIEVNDYQLAFRVQATKRETMLTKLGGLPVGKKILICPHGRHPLNSWTVTGYTDLLKTLVRQGKVYLIGGSAEQERLDQLNEAVNGAAVVLAGVLEIGELAALMVESDLLVTVDTGPMHLAAAVGLPILALFGRSDDRVWGPRGAKDRVLRVSGLTCAPCVMPRVCENRICMEQLPSDAVIQAALEMIGETT